MIIGDKFYTNPLLAKDLIEKTKSFVDFNKADILLEPSAGSGSFYFNLDSTKRIGLDLYVDEGIPEIKEMDFFEYSPDKSRYYVTIGNPPFGRVSSLAIKFFNKAATFSKYICFIVPRTFRRVSVQNKLNLNFHLIYEEEIPSNSFIPSMNAKCVYQIWEKRICKRKKITFDLETKDFYFVSLRDKHLADFAMLAYGGDCGRIVMTIPTSGLRSWHFIKIKSGKDKESVIEILQKLDYSLCEDTARQNSIGMGEVCDLYNKYTKLTKEEVDTNFWE